MTIGRGRLKNRFGITTSRVTVRAQIAWYWQLIAAVLVLAVALALAELIYDSGRRFAGFDQRESEQELVSLRERAASLEAEAVGLRSVVNASESNLQIEKTAQQQLARQVRAPEAENGRLKEDVAFFESLASSERAETGITINRLRIEPDTVPGQYRYRMLVVVQGTKKEREFRGSYQLLVNLYRDGKSAMMVLPQSNDPNANRFDISFKHFRRIEGVFEVPTDATVQGVEVRLTQNGSIRASQSASL